MREFDERGLSLAKAQGNLFVESLSRYTGSSPILIRKFMYLENTRNIDKFCEFDSARLIFELDKAKLDIGQIRYSEDVIYWIGYIYRYWAYTYEISSKRVYRKVNAHEMAKFYKSHHTMDPKFAIERIMEAKNIVMDTSFERQYEIYRRLCKRDGVI